MWTWVQAGVCVLGLFGVCFFFGKWLGGRRIFKAQEEMRALELSIKQLLQQWELTSDHNLKILTAKTEEIRDLLQVADKKSLYAHDLIDMGETCCAELQQKLRQAEEMTPAGNVADVRLRRDLQATVQVMQERIDILESRMEELRQVGELLAHQVKLVADRQRTQAVLKEETRHAVTQTPPPIRLSPVPPSVPSESADGEPPPEFAGERPSNRTVPLETPFRSPTPGNQTPTVTPVARAVTAPAESPMPPSGSADTDDPIAPRAALGSSSADPARLSRAAMAATIPEVSDDSAAAGPGLDDLLHANPGTPFHDVLKLFQQGVSVPQIARNLKMGKGEVELILNIYGNRVKMRKVM